MKLLLMRRLVVILLIIFVIVACKNNSKEQIVNNINLIKKRDSLGYLFFRERTPSSTQINLTKEFVKKEKVHDRLSQWVIYNAGTIYFVLDSIKISDSLFKSLKVEKDHILFPIGSKVIRINDKSYKVLKYDFDDENAQDEEARIYLVEDFGPLYIQSLAWGNYLKLFHGENEVDDQIIETLCETLRNSKDTFFTLPEDNR